ncbi:oxidoreductase, putative [Talaromyces stipitatus ATCC 10500]|uniref:Oxidoreductase, putative n=1 Tax=Talaromyces stipitatus (strain ATCC 10500 / CBS 375.48 / QM 6759 / NRRL 1006) TaxID=441959 RepID=B8MN93_TALSN|nr:oxidoreductase, putative [Talaromyces stipitatus ATCC 10500]EED14542.1 oxidoreductase, putative [Talaromyces stipitatus ATCC 10500]
MVPHFIFGTATLGMDQTQFQNAESVTALLKTLEKLDIYRLDTGARYPPLNPGRSEQLIGEVPKELGSKFTVDTKIYTNTKTDGSGDLSSEAIEKSVNASLQRLQRVEGVNVLYVHRPDPATPLEEQIEEFNRQISQGRCKAWGISNMQPETLQAVLDLCENRGWQKPICYQGNYNLITRGMETRLLPILRARGISYNAFQPLAAGFLTGKLVNNQHAGSRFGDENPLGKSAQKLFGAAELLDAMNAFDTRVKACGLSSLEVAIRWIAHHSALSNEDGIILGASKTPQISETVELVRKGPLPAKVLDLTEELWDAVKEIRGQII